MSAQVSLHDFADRTKKNLDLIEALAATHIGKRPTECVFDVTQLVNSLLGLLVFPQQEWFDKLPQTKLADMTEPVWKNLQFAICNLGSAITKEQKESRRTSY